MEPIVLRCQGSSDEVQVVQVAALGRCRISPEASVEIWSVEIDGHANTVSVTIDIAFADIEFDPVPLSLFMSGYLVDLASFLAPQGVDTIHGIDICLEMVCREILKDATLALRYGEEDDAIRAELLWGNDIRAKCPNPLPLGNFRGAISLEPRAG